MQTIHWNATKHVSSLKVSIRYVLWDKHLVFAPVVCANTIRLFFSVVAANDLDCHAIDINNATT
jgi:hypothetical protein